MTRETQIDEPDAFDLTGRVALVTGGSRGLGFEMASIFASHGAEVVLASRKAEACEAAAAQIRQRTGRTAVGIGCHVGKWADIDQLIGTVYEQFGRVDVLVNNAGMSPLYPSLSEVTEDLWDKVQAVNLKGPFRLSAVVGERMKAAGKGSIINVSSTSSVSPSPLEVPYAAAKAAINSLTVGLARTLSPEVRVNCIMPGMFATDISKGWNWDHVEAMVEREVPMQRVGQPSEIAAAALYLASDASSYTTGSILKVDGGVTKAVGGG